MQLGAKEDENERFAHYLRKTFKKTASLIANSCKAVSIHYFCLHLYTFVRICNINISFTGLINCIAFTVGIKVH